MDLNLTDDERRALACELAEVLVERGLALGDVERLAPLLVDRFRQAVPGTGSNAHRAREGTRPA